MIVRRSTHPPIAPPKTRTVLAGAAVGAAAAVGVVIAIVGGVVGGAVVDVGTVRSGVGGVDGGTAEIRSNGRGRGGEGGT